MALATMQFNNVAKNPSPNNINIFQISDFYL
jgi:hypothetical protein